MQATKCIECHTETFQREGICVLCKAGVTQMYKELIDLLIKDKRYKLLRSLKIWKRGKKSSKKLNCRVANSNHKRRRVHAA